MNERQVLSVHIFYRTEVQQSGLYCQF